MHARARGLYRLRRGRRGRGQAERIPRRHQLLLRRRERRAPAGVVRLRKQRCVEGGGRRLGRRLYRHQARFQQEYGKQQLQRADRWGILRFQVSQYHHARRSARVGPGDLGTSFRRQSHPAEGSSQCARLRSLLRCVGGRLYDVHLPRSFREPSDAGRRRLCTACARSRHPEYGYDALYGRHLCEGLLVLQGGARRRRDARGRHLAHRGVVRLHRDARRRGQRGDDLLRASRRLVALLPPRAARRGVPRGRHRQQYAAHPLHLGCRYRGRCDARGQRRTVPGRPLGRSRSHERRAVLAVVVRPVQQLWLCQRVALERCHDDRRKGRGNGNHHAHLPGGARPHRPCGQL